MRLPLMGLLALLLCAGAGVGVLAQEMVCNTGDAYSPLLTFHAELPPVDDAPQFPHYTLVGIDGQTPILVLGSLDGTPICASPAPGDTGLRADGPFGMVTGQQPAAQGQPLEPENQTLTLASAPDDVGAFLMVMETADATAQPSRYRLEISERVQAAGLPLSVFALALDDSAALDLQVTEGSDSAVVCPGDAGPCTVLVPISVLTLASEARGHRDDPTLIVNTATASSVAFTISGGPYLLALSLASGASTAAQPPLASVEGPAQGAYAVSCGGETPLPAVRIDLQDTPAQPLTVTAIGVENADAVLAAAPEGEALYCYDDVPAASAYALELPAWVVPPQPASAQATLSTGTTVYLANKGSGGDVFVIVEGLAAPTATFSVWVTPEMASAGAWLSAYAIATEGSGDPTLAWVTDDDLAQIDFALQPVVCDNAGIPDTCYGQTESLRGYQITLGEGQPLLLDTVDAWLDIPIYPDAAGQPLRVRVANQGSGGMVLVMRLIVDGPPSE
jgi:hypothetical protein